MHDEPCLAYLLSHHFVRDHDAATCRRLRPFCIPNAVRCDRRKWRGVRPGVGTLANGFYILAYVIVLTCLFLFLYAKRYERTLYGILMGAFVVSISAFVGYWVYSVSTLYRIPVSSITFFFLMLNLNVAGLVVVYWKPLHQVLFADRFEDSNEYYSNTMNFFLLLESVALAWPFACFSEWTVLHFGVVDHLGFICSFNPLRTPCSYYEDQPGAVGSRGRPV